MFWKSKYWKCPHCGEILRKTNLYLNGGNSREYENFIRGFETCPACEKCSDKDKVKLGHYDVSTSEARKAGF